jgi:hypothetical protein
MSSCLVYLSGPITLGDRDHNFKQASDMQRALMARGFAVVNPMLTMKLDWAWDVPHDDWMENDFPLIQRVDAMLRLPGESRGSDLEEAHARAYGIPVFYSVADLLAWREEDA